MFLSETSLVFELQRTAVLADFAKTECRAFRHNGMVDLVLEKPGTFKPLGHNTPPNSPTFQRMAC